MTRQDSVFRQIRLLENESHCEQQWLILETTHTKDSHTSYCLKHSTSYQNGLFSEKTYSTSVHVQLNFHWKKNVKHKLDQLGGISVEKNQEESVQYIPG